MKRVNKLKSVMMKLKTITVKLTIISCYNNNIKGKEEVIEKGAKAKRKRLNGKRNKVKDENKKMMNI